jgi:hypothetical protein
MRNQAFKTRGMFRVLLITFLLLGQAGAIAHELDLDAHQPGEVCKVCLLHSALDDFEISAGILPSFTGVFSPYNTQPTPLFLRLRAAPFRSRAPPQTTPV